MSVSVIIPTLEAAEQIGPLLDALRRQTVRPDEVLVVDSISAVGASLPRIRSPICGLCTGAASLPGNRQDTEQQTEECAAAKRSARGVAKTCSL